LSRTDGRILNLNALKSSVDILSVQNVKEVHHVATSCHKVVLASVHFSSAFALILYRAYFERILRITAVYHTM
jgi:hypothetical protein